MFPNGKWNDNRLLHSKYLVNLHQTSCTKSARDKSFKSMFTSTEIYIIFVGNHNKNFKVNLGLWACDVNYLVLSSGVTMGLGGENGPKWIFTVLVITQDQEKNWSVAHSVFIWQPFEKYPVLWPKSTQKKIDFGNLIL